MKDFTHTSTATGAKTIPVTLTVTASRSRGTGLSISPTGSTAITMAWTDSINWLYGVTPGLTQTIQPGLSGTYTLKPRLANLAAGSHRGAVIISGGGVTKQVPATLILKAVTTTNAANLAWNANTDSDLAGYKRCIKGHRRVRIPHRSRR